MNPIHNILVIVDPTAAEQPAVEKAALLAQKLDARMELYVCDTKTARETRLAAHARADRLPVTNLKALLEDLAAPLRARGLDVTTEVESADPLHAALSDRAQRTTAELVVKDTHQRSLAQRTFFTNTDWQLIRTCPVPLLLTKPKPWAHVPKVFAAVDPTHVNDKPAQLDNRIVDFAAFMSNRLGGELHLLHAYLPMALVAAAVSSPPLVDVISANDFAVEEDRRRELLKGLVSSYQVNPGNVHLEAGGPAEVMARVAETLQVDIIIMGAISRSGLKRIFIGSTAEDALQRLPCDALIVKPPDFAAMLAL
jgi:universal stress protein E